MPTNVARIAGLQKEWTWKTSGATRIQIRQLLDNNYIFPDGLSFHIYYAYNIVYISLFHMYILYIAALYV